MCNDPALTYLNNLGYHVVRHPKAEIYPLELIGKQRKAMARLGRLEQLLKGSKRPLPSIKKDKESAGIEGMLSSKLDISAGLEILSSALKEMFGKIGASAYFGHFAKMQFLFTDVLVDRVNMAEVGAFLQGATLATQNPLWRPYLDGEGRLFVISEVVKSRTLKGIFESNSSAGGKVDVPALQSAFGANVKVDQTSTGTVTVSFTGKEPLIFGFQCFEIDLEDGKIGLNAVRPNGGVFLSAPTGSQTAESAAPSKKTPAFPINELLDFPELAPQEDASSQSEST